MFEEEVLDMKGNGDVVEVFDSYDEGSVVEVKDSYDEGSDFLTVDAEGSVLEVKDSYDEGSDLLTDAEGSVKASSRHGDSDLGLRAQLSRWDSPKVVPSKRRHLSPATENADGWFP